MQGLIDHFSSNLQVAAERPTAYWVVRLAWFLAHVPVYWGVCYLLKLLRLGELSEQQEKRNLVSRSTVLWRILEVQQSQFTSYVGIELLGLMVNPPAVAAMRWYYVLPGLMLFDLIEYVAHRAYHHRLLYKRFHKAHHLLICPYPYSALYNSRPEFMTTGFLIFLTMRTFGFTLMEMVLVNLLGTVKTIFDHTWLGSKETHHWVHHEIDRNANFEQPWTDIWDKLFGTKWYKNEKAR